MSRAATVFLEDELYIPAGVDRLRDFRRWTHSEPFPEDARIDYLAGEIAVDMSPEDLYTHGTVKTAIVAALYRLIVESDRGALFTDRTRVTSPAAGLSAEPDVVVALDESFDGGRLVEIPAAGRRPGRYVELEGAPDLVVEIVSDRSVKKDTELLPPLYAAAGIPELWTLDARGDDLVFELGTMASNGYDAVEADPSGWLESKVLDTKVRLVRELSPRSRWRYRLESSD